MDVPHISPLALRFFRRIVRGYFRRHFTAVRVSLSSAPLSLHDDRLILYANHSSWWDPMVCVLLAQKLMPHRRHYAPMDAASLERFGILKKIGIFGVEMSSARGAANFIRGGLAILASHGVLWITPQGRFADPRERPLRFKPGMGALAARVPGGCTLQPLAIEYVFWNERLPEALLHFGEPVRVDGNDASGISERTESALLHAMQDLRELALRRDPSLFHELSHGRSGTGGFYSIFETFRRLLRSSRAPARTPPPSAHAQGDPR